MHTSGMKLTSLLLSLMLASSALGAPVPSSGVPVVNPPELGSGVVEGAAPGTMGKFNDGLKGGIKPAKQENDPLDTTIKAAAEGNPDAAKGVYGRDEGPAVTAANIADAFAGIAGIAGIAGGNGGNGLGGRSAGPPSLDHAGISSEINRAATHGQGHKRSAGPPSLDHAGISSEINRAATHGSGNSKRAPSPEEGDYEDLGSDDGDLPTDIYAFLGERSPDSVLDGVNAGKKTEVANQKPEELLKGKTTLPSASTLAGRQEKCLKGSDATKTAAGCIAEDISTKVNPNDVNKINGAAKSTTAGGKTETPKAGAPKTETPKTGTDAVASEFTDSVTPSTGAGDATSLTSALGGRDVGGPVKEVSGVATDAKKTAASADAASVKALGIDKSVPV